MLSTLPQVDLNTSITGLTGREVAEAISWIPFEITEDELVTWVLNRSVRPWTVAEQQRDLAIEQALARQVARKGIAEITRANRWRWPVSIWLLEDRRLRAGINPARRRWLLLDSIDVVPNNGSSILRWMPTG